MRLLQAVRARSDEDDYTADDKVGGRMGGRYQGRILR